jgi:hypothetical protein
MISLYVFVLLHYLQYVDDPTFYEHAKEGVSFWFAVGETT